MRDPNSFYVYVADHPVTGEPVYVGKGSGRRKDRHNDVARSGNHRNSHLARIIRKYGPLDFVIVRGALTEGEAFETERALISQFGRVGNGTGSLANLSDGGEGPAGMVLTAETRAKMSVSQKKRCGKRDLSAARAAIAAGLDPYAPIRLPAASKPKAKRATSVEHRAALSASLTGRKRSAESRERMRQAHLGKKRSSEHVAAIKAGLAVSPKVALRDAAQGDKMRLAHARGAFASHMANRGKQGRFAALRAAVSGQSSVT